MKPLKLKWKRVANPQEKYEAKAAYEAKGAQKIGGTQVAYRGLAVNPLQSPRGTSPWKVTIEAFGKMFQHFGKTFTEVKALAFEEIKALLEAKEKAAAEREALIAEIKGIYNQHGRKPNGNFDLYPDSELEKHLEALKKGKFPWKMPATEFAKIAGEGTAEESSTVALESGPMAEAEISHMEALLQRFYKGKIMACKGEGGYALFDQSSVPKTPQLPNKLDFLLYLQGMVAGADLALQNGEEAANNLVKEIIRLRWQLKKGEKGRLAAMQTAPRKRKI
ncbi:MAG: hypothetical protein ACYDIC_18185 [Desulfobaccales bacterium]